jgi:hypothetical protein
VRRTLLTLLAAALLTAGCGGGDDGPQSPQERLEAALPDYERALAEQDCRAFARYAHSAVRPPGRGTGDPPDAAECRSLGVGYTRLEGFKAARTKVFGNAALVEGTIDGQLVALVWVVDVDGRWKQVQATPPSISPQITGPPRPQNRFAPNAAAFVAAMRGGDCAKVFRLLSPAAPFLEDENEEEGPFCTRFRRSFRAPQRLAAQLSAAPGAKPIDMGGTADFHFYRLDTGGDRHWTLIMSKLSPATTAGEHLDDSVLDYYPTGLAPR